MTPEEKALESIKKAKQIEKQNEHHLKGEIIRMIESLSGELPKNLTITIDNGKNKIHIICT